MAIQIKIMANKINSQALNIMSFIVCKYKIIIIFPIIVIENPKNLWKAFIVNKFLLIAELFIYDRANMPKTICIMISKTNTHENINSVI